jgi:DNA polymerase
MTQDLYLDFEARSEADITKVGAWAYAEHPSTELLCCGWVLGEEEEVHLWLPGDPVPEEWLIHMDIGGLWVAHNKDTELCLLRRFFNLSPPRWLDTASFASAAGLPRNLHDLGLALHLDIKKLSRAALHALCKPRKLTKKNSEKWWRYEDKPDVYEELYVYCKRDVDLMRHVRRKMPKTAWVMPPREERLSDLTDTMNTRGIEVDLPGVEIARVVVAEHVERLAVEFQELVPGVNPRSPTKVAEALGLWNARKETVREALKESAETPRGRALTILKTLKTSSVSKLAAFQKRATSDGRLHGAMVYMGAGRTGRWSSMGVQLQNLIRGLGAETPDWPAIDKSDDATDRAFAALHNGSFDLMYQNVVRTVGAMMGGFLTDSSTGLLAGDLKQIEPRVLSAWAGDEAKVERFRTGVDTYRRLASRIYNVEPERVDSNQRFMGKRGELGCGYGIGKDKFQGNLKQDFDIDISLEESDRVVKAYREENPKVVSLWYAMDRFAKACVLEQWQTWKQSAEVPKVAFRMIGKWMVMRLPTGRGLWYYEPELVNEGGRFGPELYYWGRDVELGGRWNRVKTYGAKLVENGTQAMARDVMADCLLNLDDAKFHVLFQCHDEAVTADPPDRLEEFTAVMKRPPTWWPDLPVDVDVQWTRRYTK